MNEFFEEIQNPLAEAHVVGEYVDNDVYRGQSVNRGDARFVMGRSDLSEVYSCPHKWIMGFEEDDTEATEYGTLVDSMLLTPDSFDRLFAVCPDTYPDAKTGEAKPWTFAANYCKTWREQHEGKTIVKADKYAEADIAIRRLITDPDVCSLLSESKRQVMVVGKYADKETGLEIPVKGLIDIVPKIKGWRFDKSLADLKTTADASPRGWARAIHQRRYHWQAALYLDLWTKATGEDRVEFLHLVQENFAPWEHAKRLVSSEFVSIGRQQYIAALKRYCQCLKTGQWPGYDDEASAIQGWSLVQPEPWMVMQS